MPKVTAAPQGRAAQVNNENGGILSTNDRLLELATVLAAGVIRSRLDQSSGLSADHGDSSLDLLADQSGYRAHQTRGVR